LYLLVLLKGIGIQKKQEGVQWFKMMLTSGINRRFEWIMRKEERAEITSLSKKVKKEWKMKSWDFMRK